MKFFGFTITRSKEPTNEASRKHAVMAHRARGLLQAADTSRLESSWANTPHSADAYITQNWLALVARARDAAQNDPHARKFVQLFKDNVAGPRGFRFRADVKDPNGKTDMIASNAIEAEFKRFSRKENFDVTGRLSRGAAERLWCSLLSTEGEAIAVRRYGAAAGPYGFAIQIVDPCRLDPNQNEVLRPGGNYIRHGIEFTQYGRPVRYYFREYDETQVGYVTMMGQKYQIIEAADVIHDFLPELVEQKRGLSPMRAALWRMRMLKGYEDAAVTNARVGAAKMGFFRDPNAELPDGEDLPIDAEPGTFQNIGGLELQQFDPQYPSGDFGPFMQRCLMSIASGLGPSYHNIASDLSGVNYTSSRTGELAERELWKGVQGHVIESFCEKVYGWWVEYVLLTDRVKIAGKPLKMEREERYKDAGGFTGRRWQWVDPQKEISAHAQAVELGVKSRQSIIRENSEDDPWDVWDEIEEERKELESRGVPIDNPKHIQAQASAAAAESGMKGGAE